MSILFFYMIFFVLTADGLMVFLTPVIVYQLTGSIEYSGLSYALWWLPRIFLIPLIGRYIDRLGIRPLSVLADFIKTAGCLFLVLYDFSSDLVIAIAFGIVGSLISIGNSQTIISYEKIVSLISSKKEHHANLISRMDFLGMILGPLIGMIMIDYGYRYLLLLPCALYIANAFFFIFKINTLNFKENNTHSYHAKEIKPPQFKDHFIYIVSIPALVLTILLAVGNNMFDGLVESGGTALIERKMHLPAKYFGFIDIAAGVCGVLGTYCYGFITTKMNRNNLLILAILLIVSSSVLLITFQSSFIIFICGYALSIIGKVFTGNICRMIRIEMINPAVFAGTSSVIVLLNQAILPLVGAAIYFSEDSTYVIYALMTIAIGITFLAGLLLYRNISMSRDEKNISDTA